MAQTTIKKGGGGSEQWSDSRYILKAGSTEFANLSMCSVKKREVKNGSRDFCLGRKGVPIS